MSNNKNNHTAALLNSFKNISTGNVADAMDELGLRRSVISGIPCIGTLRETVAGVALTIKQARRSASSPEGNLALHGKIIDEETMPGTIIVIDAAGISDVSIGGGIQMTIAKNKGAAAYITNGSLRDVDEIKELDFPVFAASSSPLKSGLDVETIGVNIPIMLNNTQIKPQDVLVIDHTGIVVIPAEKAVAVLEQAQRIQQRESRLLQYLKQGYSLVEARALIKPKQETKKENV